MGSPGLTQRLFPVLLLCASGLLAWALWHEEPDDEDPFAESSGSTGLEEHAPTPHGVTGEAGATNVPPRSASRRGPTDREGIPRLMPPDAAIEDVRDALAKPASERSPALQLAYRSISQLAAEDGGVLRGLRRYLDAVDDPVVRGVSIAALGSERSDTHVAWLAGRLGDGPSAEDRLGALIALAHAAADEATAAKTANAPSLGGLTYTVGALPLHADVRAGLATFLDRENTKAAVDALPILLPSLGRSATQAALLVTKDGRVCRLLAALPAEPQTLLVAAALRHRELPAQVRGILEALRAR